MTINYVIRLVKEKQTQHLVRSLGLMVTAGVIAIAMNALTLWTVYDFSKESKRGGQLIMQPDKTGAASSNDKTKGLSKEYAFQWSYGKMESLSLMFPGVMGYGTHYAERDGEPYMFPSVGENSHVITYMSEKMNVPSNAIDQISGYMSQQLYWGDQPFTMSRIPGCCILFSVYCRHVCAGQ